MSEDEGLSDLFGQEDGDRPPSPEAHVIDFRRANGEVVHVRLVGRHPLWGHILYPSAERLARLIESQPELIRGKNVVEFGAGGGLPGMIAALEGAETTVISDFNDPDLVDNLERNVRINCSAIVGRAHALGYTWSHNADALLDMLREPHRSFDVVLMADLVFNNSQHDALLAACEACLKGRGLALCFYGLHRPKKADADQAIFTKAEARGWRCELIFKDEKAGVRLLEYTVRINTGSDSTCQAVFPGDEGDLLMRSTVYGWRMIPPLTTGLQS